jgi:hypothetical protein
LSGLSCGQFGCRGINIRWAWHTDAVAIVHGSLVAEAARDWCRVALVWVLTPRVAAGVDIVRAGALPIVSLVILAVIGTEVVFPPVQADA